MPTAVENVAFGSAFTLLPAVMPNGIIIVSGLGGLSLLPQAQSARPPAR